MKNYRKLMVAICVIVILCSMAMALFGCIDDVSKQFDLSEEKIYWKGSIDDNFKDDRVCIVFKRTDTYPQLKISDFKFSNGARIEYDDLRPHNTTDANYLARYRQMATIYLKDTGKDKVVEAVEYLQTLDFIKCVEPDMIFEPMDDVVVTG